MYGFFTAIYNKMSPVSHEDEPSIPRLDLFFSIDFCLQFLVGRSDGINCDD